MKLLKKTFKRKPRNKGTTKVQDIKEGIESVQTDTTELEIFLFDPTQPYIETICSDIPIAASDECEVSDDSSKYRPWSLSDLLKESNVKYGLHDFKEALFMFEALLSMQIIQLGENHPDVALTLKRLGCCQYECGNYQESVRARSKAIMVWKSCESESYAQEIAFASSRIKFTMENNY